MFGIDDAAIAAIVATIASSAIQVNAANRAAARQQAAAQAAQQRQLLAQNEATRAVAQRADDFDPQVRQGAQDDIAAVLTQKFSEAAQPQVTAQGVQVGASVPAASESPAYTAARAKEQAKTAASLHALAGLMGRIGAAGQLRQGEAIRIGDTATDIGRVQSGANNVAGIDQVAIGAAGRPDLFSQIGAAALNAYGMSKLATLGLPKAPTGSTGTGLSLTSPSGTGLRAPSSVSWLT